MLERLRNDRPFNNFHAAFNFNDVLKAQNRNIVAARRTQIPYETSEHVEVVDTSNRAGRKSITLFGIPVTYGQLSALADFLQEPAEVFRIGKQDPARFKKIIEKLSENDSKPSQPWVELIGEDYFKLKESNSDHFIKGTEKNGKNNQSSFERYFYGGTQNAFINPDYASVSTGWALHYLTDAFASGHMFNKDDFMGQFKKGMDDKESRSVFFSQLAKSVWDSKGADVLKDYEVQGIGFLQQIFGAKSRNGVIDSQKKLQNLFEDIYLKEPDKIANLAVCALHDSLNETGVEVQDGTGATWTTYGDGALDKSPETKSRLQKAVGMTLDEMERGKQRQPRQFKADDIWTFVPRPTRKGSQFIYDQMKEFSNPRSSNLIDMMSKRIIEDMPVGIEALKKQGLLRLKPRYDVAAAGQQL